MAHPIGAGSEGDFRLDFDARVLLEFHGSKISSDGGLLLYRELDEALSLFDKTVRFLRDTRKGKNGVHTLMGLLRQSVFGRLAGYEDVNDAARLSRDPVMRQIIGGRAVDGQAASCSQMGRFEYPSWSSPFLHPDPICFYQCICGLNKLSHDRDDGDFCGFSCIA